MHLPSLDSVNYTLAILGIAAILVGWLRGWFESPNRRLEREQNQEIHWAILGEAERRDRSGTITREGQPGLVALQRRDSERLTKVEETLVEFRHVVGLLTETQKRLDVHDRAINALISGSLERAATAMSSAALLNAVANNDLLNGEADEVDGEIG